MPPWSAVECRGASLSCCHTRPLPPGPFSTRTLFHPDPPPSANQIAEAISPPHVDNLLVTCAARASPHITVPHLTSPCALSYSLAPRSPPLRTPFLQRLHTACTPLAPLLHRFAGTLRPPPPSSSRRAASRLSFSLAAREGARNVVLGGRCLRRRFCLAMKVRPSCLRFSGCGEAGCAAQMYHFRLDLDHLICAN